MYRLMELFKKLILIVLYFSVVFLVFFVINLFDRLPAFQEYHCEKGGFTVLLPGPAEESAKKLPPLLFPGSINVVKAGCKGSKFEVMYFKRPRRGRNKVSDDICFEMLKGITGITGNCRFIKDNEVDSQDYAVKEFEFRFLERVTIKARVILLEEWCYQLVVTSDSADVIGQKSQQFFDSFKLDE